MIIKIIITAFVSATILYSTYLWVGRDSSPPLIASLIIEKHISEVTGNLSGITWDPLTKTLLAITNNPEKLIQFDTKGNVISTFPLSGMNDTESITYGWDNTYIVAEERLRKITAITLNFEEKNYTKLPQSLIFDLGGKKNEGLEGIAYSKLSGALFIANEKRPATIFKIDGFNRLPQQFTIKKIYTSAKDISGLAWSDNRQRLYVLSDEGKSLVEMDSEGMIHRTSMLSSFTKNMPQPEGISVNNDTIYIVSEPNLFYVFKMEK